MQVLTPTRMPVRTPDEAGSAAPPERTQAQAWLGDTPDEPFVGAQTRTASFRPDAGSSGAQDLPHPESVGRYQIQELVGRGAFGSVYLGWDPQLKRQVAIKVPRFAAGSGDDQIEAFLDEARRAVQLERHAGIVPVYDAGRDGDLCYIVSQFIEGGTLAQRLRRGPLPVDAAVSLAIRLADIVHFAHRQGWVHRDIKPSNILLDSEESPYLADFGLTARLDELHSAHGTPNYMAPELAREALAQLRGEKETATLHADERSDIYSLGVVLYEMLAGRLPFHSSDVRELFEQVLHGELVSPREPGARVVPRLDDVCFKALARDPAERYRSAAELRDELRVVATALEGAIPSKLDERSVSGSSRVRFIAAAGTALLLFVLLGVVYYFASSAWRKPVEHTSPGGETNVAMVDNKSGAFGAKSGGARTTRAAPGGFGGGVEPQVRGGVSNNGHSTFRPEPLPVPYFAEHESPIRLSADKPAREQLGSLEKKHDREDAEKQRDARFRMLVQQDLLCEAVELAEARGDRLAKAEALVSLGCAQSRAGDEALAILSFVRANEALPESASYETRTTLYSNWISSLLAEKRLEEAREPLARLRRIARPGDEGAKRILKAAEGRND